MKGYTAEVSSSSPGLVAGPSENIRRTVTKVERYHGLELYSLSVSVCISVDRFAAVHFYFTG